ncbi:sel1 repeat family protein [Undibacterium seohonense]|uniref:Sel1 repeat family protein n=1 Tax=Undibacterium seohonense TaxID=1344950 RepID=A0ABR6X7L5_9BURK|nr:tetratricopeptide repeat protein [Undibacterium seohonense]MBC3808884.1 sel1 repeat family protein [Undibacterium seohonense]
MFDIPSFFIDHQIDQDADERTIKRAYAKALKQIDQDNDLEGFQSLREDYERALAWARSKDWREQYVAEQNAEGEQSTDLDSTSAHVNSESNVATSKEDDVIADTYVDSKNVASTEHVSQEPTSSAVENGEEQVVYAIDIARNIFMEFLHHLGEKAEEVGQTEFLLRMYLDDERLINVEIRDLFEWLIAERLAQGWQTGNGDLFGAAVKCFGWHQDKHRILRFHDFGYYLDRAVDEMSAFNLQEEARTNRQVGLIRLARNDAPPTKQFLRENIYFIDEMLSNYPTWLAMVTKYENLQTWHKRAEEYKFFQPPKLSRKALNNFFENNDWSAAIAFCIFVLVMSIGIIMLDSSGTHPSKDSSNTQIISTDASSANLVIQAIRFLEGKDGFSKNEDEALRYFKLASDNGSLEGDIGLARIYQNEKSKHYDPASAHRLWFGAAEAGMPEAWLAVALHFDEGIGVEKDVTKALYWYRRSAEFGNAAAIYNLAIKYERGDGVPVNHREAFELYESAAMKGNHLAQGTLSSVYLEGKFGKKVNLQKGLDWLKIVAENGDPKSQFLYAEVFEFAKYGVTQDLEMAANWYRNAQTLGHLEANEALNRVCVKLNRYGCNV